VKPSALLAKLARVLDPPPPPPEASDGAASPLPGGVSLGLNVRRAAPPGEALSASSAAAQRPRGGAPALAAAAPSAPGGPAGAAGARQLQILLVEDQVRGKGGGRENGGGVRAAGRVYASLGRGKTNFARADYEGVMFRPC
jgi:hypothetical protein